MHEEVVQIDTQNGIVGSSPAMVKVFEQIQKIAPTSSSILIRGESGTGKELVARAIHRQSLYRNNPFIAVSCAALPEGVLESELFGHEKGAFTGAFARREGRFELAEGGTFFLDEIGDISLKTQVQLLRVLQEKEFERVGGNQTLKANVRVIAATHLNLEEAITTGKFRMDLFYRLNVIVVEVPPLRERMEDLKPLCLHFIQKYNSQMRKNIRGIDDGALEFLMDYSWPGNVRELENWVQRAMALTEGETITAKDFSGGNVRTSVKNGLHRETPVLESSYSYWDRVKFFEKKILLEALRETQWRKEKAAHLLGMSRSTFFYKLKDLGLLSEVTS